MKVFLILLFAGFVMMSFTGYAQNPAPEDQGFKKSVSFMN